MQVSNALPTFTSLTRSCVYFNRYWHRSLNPKKLIDVGFSHIGRNMTLPRTLKLYRLDEQPKTKGFRKMTLADCPSAFKILKEVF